MLRKLVDDAGEIKNTSRCRKRTDWANRNNVVGENQYARMSTKKENHEGDFMRKTGSFVYCLNCKFYAL